MSNDSERDDSGNREHEDEQHQARAKIERIRADAADAITREAIRRKTEHVIHNQDGTVSERDSYGTDPASRPG